MGYGIAAMIHNRVRRIHVPVFGRWMPVFGRWMNMGNLPVVLGSLILVGGWGIAGVYLLASPAVSSAAGKVAPAAEEVYQATMAPEEVYQATAEIGWEIDLPASGLQTVATAGRRARAPAGSWRWRGGAGAYTPVSWGGYQALAGVQHATTYVHFRTGPGRRFEAVGTLAPGQPVEVVGGHRGWYTIRLMDGGTAYVYGAYLSGGIASTDFSGGYCVLGGSCYTGTYPVSMVVPAARITSYAVGMTTLATPVSYSLFQPFCTLNGPCYNTSFPGSVVSPPGSSQASARYPTVMTGGMEGPEGQGRLEGPGGAPVPSPAPAARPGPLLATPVGCSGPGCDDRQSHDRLKSVAF